MERKKTAVALGLFDGVHLGHRAVLRAAYAQSKNGLIPSAFTFEPGSVLRKAGGSSGYIYGQRAKIRLLNECGIARTDFPPFDTVCGLSGEEFASRILHERMNAAYVCCGNDFRFGRDASCGAQELIGFGKRYGFEVEVVDSVKLDGETVSSSRIRELLLSGDITAANELLGSAYFINATVTDGNHIGRTIDFPTINQEFAEGQLVPRYGVYSTHTNVGGRVLPSVTNVGVKPTVGGVDRPLAETHIIGYSGDLYGKNVDVCFSGFIRPERKFGSLDELKAQIAADIMRAREQRTT
ncbi:MAG: bifunctional riboflavin kinase/FAD synthetase [Ruminococcus sp.]|nr:bifunctional riboflavin kinase/FAD synthetase [Ruminococcus sp.]